MKIKGSIHNILNKVIIIICITAVIDFFGVAFLALKVVSVPFVPNRNIDNMSDYYTAVWESVKGNSIDNGRFSIIDITENSRKEIADILGVVKNMNPKIIGLDVSPIWEEDDSIDKHLVNMIQTSSNLILPVEYYENGKDDNCFLYSIFNDKFHDKVYGVVSFPQNKDILRTYSTSFKVEDQHIDAFSYAIAEICGADVSTVKDKENLLINYTTLHLTDDDAIPGKQFLNLNERDSSFLASEIQNRIVLLGSTHQTSDQHLTPLGHNLSGVMIHAHVINSMIENKNITSTPWVVKYIICLFLAFLSLVYFNIKSSSKKKETSIWRTIAMSLVFLLTSLILFSGMGTIIFCKYSYYIDFAPYIVTLIIAYFLKDKNIKFVKK